MFILQGIIDIVREASSFMMKDSFCVSSKEGYANIVTDADISVQHFLTEKLSAMIPGSGFLCEEEEFCVKGNEFEWIIDPIDGTTNLSRGLKESAVCVALARNGEVVDAVVFNPFKDMLFSAEKGIGAFLNGNPIHVSERIFEDSIFFTALCVYRKQFAPLCMEVISEIYPHISDVRRFASCALELCYIASGSAEMLFEMRVMPWDYAAAGLILTEAGGCFCGIGGETLKYDRPVLITAANSTENLEKIQIAVNRHIKSLPYDD